jgi:hypothetical protein
MAEPSYIYLLNDTIHVLSKPVEVSNYNGSLYFKANGKAIINQTFDGDGCSLDPSSQIGECIVEHGKIIGGEPKKVLSDGTVILQNKDGTVAILDSRSVHDQQATDVVVADKEKGSDSMACIDTSAQLGSLTVTPAENSDADFALTVTSTTTDSNGDTEIPSDTIDVSVADAPTLTVAAEPDYIYILNNASWVISKLEALPNFDGSLYLRDDGKREIGECIVEHGKIIGGEPKKVLSDGTVILQNKDGTVAILDSRPVHDQQATDTNNDDDWFSLIDYINSIGTKNDMSIPRRVNFFRQASISKNVEATPEGDLYTNNAKEASFQVNSKALTSLLEGCRPSEIKVFIGKLMKTSKSDSEKCGIIRGAIDIYSAYFDTSYISEYDSPPPCDTLRVLVNELKDISRKSPYPKYKGLFREADELLQSILKSEYKKTESPGWFSLNITLFNSFRSAEGIIADMQTRARENKGGSSEEALKKVKLNNHFMSK